MDSVISPDQLEQTAAGKTLVSTSCSEAMRCVGNIERDSSPWEAVVKNDQSLVLEPRLPGAHLPEMSGKDTQVLILVSSLPLRR